MPHRDHPASVSWASLRQTDLCPYEWLAPSVCYTFYSSSRTRPARRRKGAMRTIIRDFGLVVGFMVCAECFGQLVWKAFSSPIDEAVSPQERQALLALYEATDGSHWKDHTGWLGPVGTECAWYGVECAPRGNGQTAVYALVLFENNLHGTIPAALGQLAHLESLHIFGNHLSGMLPDALVRRWRLGLLDVSAEGSLLTDVSEIDFESSASALLCGRDRIVLRSDGSAVFFTERCRNTTPKDRATFCEVKEGRILGMEFATLALLVEKNGFFSLQRNYQRNITDSLFLSTRVTRGAKTYEVVDYAGGGPFELWVIQRAIEGVASSIEWEKTKTLAACPRWDGSKSPR